MNAEGCSHLRWLREASGMTQAELARRSGVSVRTIRSIEVGEIRTPRRHSLNLVLDAVDATPRQRSEALNAWSSRRGRTLTEQLRRGVDLDRMVEAAGMSCEPDCRLLAAWSRTEIGENRRTVETRYQHCIEFTEEGSGVYYALFSGDQAIDTRLMQVDRTVGCTFANRLDLPEENVTLFEFGLGGTVRKGDTRSFSYTILEQARPSDADLVAVAANLGDSDGATHGDRRPIAHLAMEVSFHPHALPEKVEQISWDHAGSSQMRV